jgi:RNA polymerase sigma factor (sigma-70 family)
MPAENGSQTGTTLHMLLRDPGDPRAWRAFVQRYTPKVLAWCRQWHLQPEDAQDVAQEVMYKLHRQLRHFSYDPAKGSFRAWLKGVAHHVWTDFRESRRRAGWGSGDPYIHRLLEELESRESLAAALEDEFMQEVYEEAKLRVQLRVTRSTWLAFELLTQEKWSSAQVAAHLNMKVATVYMAKKRVQAMLAQEIRKITDPDGADGAAQP